MGEISMENIRGIYKDGKLSHSDNVKIPDEINEKDILTSEMIENSDTLYFDDFTGEQITA